MTGPKGRTPNWDDVELLRLPHGESVAFLPSDPRSIDLLARLHRSGHSTVRLGLSILRHSPTAGHLLCAVDPHHSDSHAHCLELLAAVHSLLDEEFESIAFNIAPDASRATIAVLKSSGETIFIKARSIEDTRLADMAEFLRHYRDKCPSVIDIPEPLAEGRCGRWSMVALSDVGSGQPTDGVPALEDLVPFLNAIRETSSEVVSPSQAFDTLVASVDDSDSSDGDSDSEASQLIAALRAAGNSEPMQLSVAHGDFVPWNMWHQGGSLHLWDWDKVVVRAPWPYDAIHYAFQTRRSLRNQTHSGALSGAMDDIRYHASALGMPQLAGDVERSFATYAAWRTVEETRLGRTTADGQWLVGEMLRRVT